MKKYHIILLLFIPLLSIAQSNYKKGYVVNLKGDTLQGYIDYKEWGNNPKSINFKYDLNDKTQQLGTNAIKYFEISGLEYYQRFIVQISLDAVDIDNASTGINTAAKTDTVFLRALQKGKNVTLYTYKDDIKNRFYIKDNGMSAPQELLYKVYFDPDNTSSLITKNTYYGQLTILANNQNMNLDEITNQIKQLNYKEDDLVKIISKINGDDEKLVAKISNNQNRNRFFIGVGLNASALKYEGDSPFQNAPGATSFFPKLTFGFDNFFNPNVGRLILRFEVALTMNNFTVTSISNPPYYTYQHTDMQKVKELTASLTPQVIYNFYNADPIKFFLGAGFSLNASSYPTNQYSTDYNNTTTTNKPLEMRNFAYSVPVKAGIVLNKKLEMYATSVLQLFPLTNNYAYFSGNVTTYEFGFNYLLGKKH